jgi:hypothetical protein
LKIIGSAVFGVDEGDAGGAVSLEVVPELDDRVKDRVFLRPIVKVIKLFSLSLTLLPINGTTTLSEETFSKMTFTLYNGIGHYKIR